MHCFIFRCKIRVINVAWLWFWSYSFLSEDGKNNGESEMCETTTVIIDTSNIKVEDGGLIHLEECPEDDESKQFFSFSTLFYFYTVSICCI